MSAPEPEDETTPPKTPTGTSSASSRETPGGPYFGRLLVVLLLAVLFCGFMTWLLSTFVTD